MGTSQAALFSAVPLSRCAPLLPAAALALLPCTPLWLAVTLHEQRVPSPATHPPTVRRGDVQQVLQRIREGVRRREPRAGARAACPPGVRLPRHARPVQLLPARALLAAGGAGQQGLITFQAAANSVGFDNATWPASPLLQVKCSTGLLGTTLRMRVPLGVCGRPQGKHFGLEHLPRGWAPKVGCSHFAHMACCCALSERTWLWPALLCALWAAMLTVKHNAVGPAPNTHYATAQLNAVNCCRSRSQCWPACTREAVRRML